MTKEYKDRFSDPTKAQSEKSAFICETCNQQYSGDSAKQKKMTCCGSTLKKLT